MEKRNRSEKERTEEQRQGIEILTHIIMSKDLYIHCYMNRINANEICQYKRSTISNDSERIKDTMCTHFLLQSNAN